MSCPECGCNVIIYDECRGERYCRDCGLVIGYDGIVSLSGHSPLHVRSATMFWQDRRFLDKYGGKEYLSDMERRRRRRNILVREIASNFGLLDDERNLVWYILDKVELSQLCWHTQFETIIAGVCRYCISCLHPRRVRSFHFSKGVCKFYDLTRDRYNIIVANIKYYLD